MMRHAGKPPGPDDRVLKLPDGRLLGYAEYGDPAGRALFFFHESPGSRLSGAFLDSAAKERGIRVVALERPGFGLSDYQPGRRVGDWPADVREAARQLGWERFAVLGCGAGGPYALACAASPGEQLTAVCVVSGEGLPTGAGPGRLRAKAGIALDSLLVRRAPALYFRTLLRNAPQADRAQLSAPALRAALLRSAREAFRHGTRGVAEEAALVSKPWGVELAAVSAPVSLWQGEAESPGRVAAARALAAAIPACVATFVPGAGRYWVVEHAAAVLEALEREAAPRAS